MQNPVSTVAKASQLVLGGVTHGKYTDDISPVTGYNNHALRVNLLAGLHSAGTAAQTADMTGDLKTGHLVGAKPVNQFIAQGVGALVSCFVSTGLYVVLIATRADLPASSSSLQLRPASSMPRPRLAPTARRPSLPGAPSPSPSRRRTVCRSRCVPWLSRTMLTRETTSGILAIVLSVVAAICACWIVSLR